MAKAKIKIRSHLIRWLESLRTNQSISKQALKMTNQQWYELYKIRNSKLDTYIKITSLRQMTFYLSSIAYDQLIEGFSRIIIRQPKYQLYYVLILSKGTTTGDQTVEKHEPYVSKEQRQTTESPSKSFLHCTLQVSQINPD